MKYRLKRKLRVLTGTCYRSGSGQLSRRDFNLGLHWRYIPAASWCFCYVLFNIFQISPSADTSITHLVHLVSLPWFFLTVLWQSTVSSYRLFGTLRACGTLTSGTRHLTLSPLPTTTVWRLRVRVFPIFLVCYSPINLPNTEKKTKVSLPLRPLTFTSCSLVAGYFF